MKDLTLPLLQKRQVHELTDERNQIVDMLQDPFLNKKLKSPGDMRKRIRDIDTQLSRYAPEPLKDAEKDKLAKMEVELRERITENMPTDEEMRKNPVGAVHHHTLWEKTHKQDILTWKNIKRQLEPDSDDPDLANIERYRPSGAMNRLRTDAQIHGVMSYGNVPEENWNRVFPGTPNSALAQAKRAEANTDDESMVSFASSPGK